MFALKPEDRMMVLLPAFWLAGMSTVLQVLATGATLVWPESTDVDDALDLIASARVTRVNAWGDRQPLLVRRAAERGIDLAHIPEFGGFPGGDGAPPVPRMYGMTESFSAHSAWPLDRPLPAGKEGSFGVALGGYERRVVDLETGAVLLPDQVGELQIRGPALMAGLYKQRRADTFTADGFYPTGDIVRIDADGWLFPEGRLHDRIKTRAANVSRLEVEAALLALPGVAQAVVTGLPDAEAGEIVVAAVVPEGDAELGEAALQQALRATAFQLQGAPQHRLRRRGRHSPDPDRQSQALRTARDDRRASRSEPAMSPECPMPCGRTCACSNWRGPIPRWRQWFPTKRPSRRSRSRVSPIAT